MSRKRSTQNASAVELLLHEQDWDEIDEVAPDWRADHLENRRSDAATSRLLSILDNLGEEGKRR